MKYQVGDIVIHKATKERLMILKGEVCDRPGEIVHVVYTVRLPSYGRCENMQEFELLNEQGE